jgi:hypothetical protein
MYNAANLYHVTQQMKVDWQPDGQGSWCYLISLLNCFFSVFPTVILPLYSHGARLSPLFPVWKSI